MDVTAIAKLATSIAETGNRQEVQVAVLKRALDMQGATATQLINAVQPAPQVQNQPAHHAKKINNTA